MPSPIAPTRPGLAAADAERFALALWGLESSASELPSERDQNFRLRSARGEFVLKVAGSSESDEVLDLQNRALAWIAARDPDLPVPHVVPTPA